MYLEFVEALPINASGLNFLKDMSFLSEGTLFSNLSSALKSTFGKLIKYIPDLALPGDYHDRGKLFDLDPVVKDKPDHYLLITGVPDNTPSLDFYKIKDAIYTQYVEMPGNKGCLFQVISSKSPLTPISYGTH